MESDIWTEYEQYEKSLSRWDGEMMRDNERWIIGLEFSKKNI
jgi:hypothetical protein